MNTNTISIPAVGKPVSPLALGTAFYRKDNKDQWFSVLDDYTQHGGTVLDSGRIYGDSEDLLGMWMESRGTRDTMIVITKGGHGPNDALPQDDLPAILESELTTSLDCLLTDHVDLYLLHRDNPKVPVGEIVDCLNAELARGRIKAFGVSNWEYDRLIAANQYAADHGLTGLAAVSNNISLPVPTGPFYGGLVSVNSDGERWHEQSNVPLIVWSAQARGFFTGRYTPAMRDNLAQVTDAHTRRMLEVYGTDNNFERLRRATVLGQSKGDYSAMQVGLAWLLYKPFPLVPIVGPHTVSELASCRAALDVELTEHEVDWLKLQT